MYKSLHLRVLLPRLLSQYLSFTEDSLTQVLVESMEPKRNVCDHGMPVSRVLNKSKWQCGGVVRMEHLLCIEIILDTVFCFKNRKYAKQQ